MKRIFFALCILAVVVSAPRQAKAETDVSIDFFYDNLGDDGSWVDVGDYGYCWQPNVAVSNSKWRPYSDGYWAYTDVGWTWVSNERFGWATYHYGRWARLHDQGWVWVPGREWGPAWVSWRTGGDYVGWAPLPPHRGGGGGEVVYEGRPVDSRVDIDFDIGPAYYNFVDVRYIGDPVLSDRIFEPAHNLAYINGTVNVTNITYNNSTFYNHGPDYNRLSAYSTRPIRRMTLERQANVDFATAARSGGFTRVQGDKLVVAAPQQLHAPSHQQQHAPKAFKPRIAKPEVETGWMGMTDPKAKAELQQKIKKEDPRSIPPAKIQPTNPAALSAAPVDPDAAPSLGGTTAPVTTAPPVALPNGKGKGRRGASAAPLPPSASPVAPGTDPIAVAAPNSSPSDLQHLGKGKNKRGRNKPIVQPLVSQPDGTPTPDAAVASMPMPNENKGKGRNRGNKGANGQSGQPPLAPQAGSDMSPVAETSVPSKHNQKGKSKGERIHPGESAQPVAVQKVDVPPSDPATVAASAHSQALPKKQAHGGERQMRPAPPQHVVPSNGQPVPQQGGGKPEKGKKNKKGQEEPSPAPAQ